MKLSYRIVNVFAIHGQRLTGNPLCVFEDASALSDADMQALALQFNLAETSFVSPSATADARVRIFTPEYEMPFAGHPTLGTAHVVASLRGVTDRVALELNVGVIPVTRDGDLWELGAKHATFRVPQASRADLAAALGVDAADLSGPPLWMNAGVEQLIVPLASPEAVRRAKPRYDALAVATTDSQRPNALVFATTGDGALLSRYFYSQTGTMLEDPATGSATANLGGWFLAQGVRPPVSWTIAQGEATGRPSALRLRIDDRGDVFVAGEVVELGRGFVDWV